VKVVSCRPAWVKTSNRFTTLFSEALQGAGWKVREFSWAPAGVFSPKVVLLHWPDELFTASNAFEHAKVAVKLALLQTAKQLFGVRLVWVVHETAPHDRGRNARWSTRSFLRALDGAIYLSHASRVAGEAEIPALRQIPALVTRHGHYRFDMETGATPRRVPGEPVKLVYFGQIRPYKGLDALIRAASGISPDNLRIKIIGWSKLPDFTQRLTELARDAAAVTLDIRDELVRQADLEAVIDESDGVVLPYRNILNSGAALFALSRNRPVMAPRLGTLPELQNEIGPDWVHLYDSADVSADDLQSFTTLLRSASARTADLSRYEWGPIGESIGAFFDQLVQKQGATRASELKPETERTWR
jgi:glycosyltransferase involved in cell wall biosynthesis